VAQSGLARLHGVQEVGGSNPLAPTIWGLFQLKPMHMGVNFLIIYIQKFRVQLPLIILLPIFNFLPSLTSDLYRYTINVSGSVFGVQVNYAFFKIIAYCFHR
jgi:hypothetical protein